MNIPLEVTTTTVRSYPTRLPRPPLRERCGVKVRLDHVGLVLVMAVVQPVSDRRRHPIVERMHVSVLELRSAMAMCIDMSEILPEISNRESEHLSRRKMHLL